MNLEMQNKFSSPYKPPNTGNQTCSVHWNTFWEVWEDKRWQFNIDIQQLFYSTTDISAPFVQFNLLVYEYFIS